MCVNSVIVLYTGNWLDCRTCSGSCCGDVSISARPSSATRIYQCCCWTWTPNKRIWKIDSGKTFSTTGLYSVTTRWHSLTESYLFSEIMVIQAWFILIKKPFESHDASKRFLPFVQDTFASKIIKKFLKLLVFSWPNRLTTGSDKCCENSSRQLHRFRKS